ncbi:hypothetical protein ACFYQ5_32305 [Streptomyces sp. NPDC005794]|uniref:hypothetical protein n=1 Tax=Streptomyces sp. NPDC005794 TaxID=3364733 RepID=UPI00369ED228
MHRPPRRTRRLVQKAGDVRTIPRSRTESYRREPRDPHGLLDRLDAGGAPQFAAEFRRRLRDPGCR